MSKLKTFIVFLFCVVFFASCSSTTENNTVANADNTNSENEANLSVYKLPDKEIPRANTNEEPKKPEVLYPPSIAKLELSGTNRSNIYNVLYTPKQSKRAATEISIITMESELIGIEIRYRDSKTMIRLLNKEKYSGYDSGKKFVKSRDPRISKCFTGARKFVGKYETALKVSESLMQTLLLNDCPEFPKTWMIPLSEENYDGDGI